MEGSNDSWVRVLISDVCESIVDCVNKTAPTVPEPTPYRMIRTTNVKSGRINMSEVKFVTREVYERWTRNFVSS
jgi:type I restriction enzyme S subunit